MERRMILIVRGHINIKAEKYVSTQWKMYESGSAKLSAANG